MIEVDARGLACPEPVVKAKKALEGVESGEVMVLVDNSAARDNVRRMAETQGHKVEIEEEGKGWRVRITKLRRYGITEGWGFLPGGGVNSPLTRS